MTAYRDGDRVVVAIPARFTGAQESEWVRRMVDRLADSERRRRPSDDELAVRASELSARYLDGRSVPTSVNWSSNQGRRWGSCTPAEGSIRISTRVRGMPRWVIDYVLLHELVHMLHVGHGPEFWAALNAYPRTERARGFLEGVTFGEERAARADPDVGPLPAFAVGGDDDDVRSAELVSLDQGPSGALSDDLPALEADGPELDGRRHAAVVTDTAAAMIPAATRT